MLFRKSWEYITVREVRSSEPQAILPRGSTLGFLFKNSSYWLCLSLPIKSKLRLLQGIHETVSVKHLEWSLVYGTPVRMGASLFSVASADMLEMWSWLVFSSVLRSETWGVWTPFSRATWQNVSRMITKPRVFDAACPRPRFFPKNISRGTTNTCFSIYFFGKELGVT